MIGGKLYDTEKAELLHWWDNGGNAWDFRAMEERLYRTKDGSLFIAGSGGPMTRYRTRVVGEGWDPGSGIRVVSKDEAISWLEEHGGTEVILDHFAEELKGGEGLPDAAGKSEATGLVDKYRLDYTGLIDNEYRVAGWCDVRVFEPDRDNSHGKPVIVISEPEDPGYRGPSVSDNFATIAAEVLARHELSAAGAVLIDFFPGNLTVSEEFFDLVTFPDAEPEGVPDKLGEPLRSPIDRPTVERLVGITKQL